MSAIGKHEYMSQLLKHYGIAEHVVVFSESTKTSQDAANQIGCPLAQIGKNIVFRARVAPSSAISAKNQTQSAEILLSGDNAISVIASGANRVSPIKLQQLINAPVEKADANFVLEKTGFPIGGVTPFGHKTPMAHTFIDQDLMQFQTIWCAGGTPHAVFEIPTQKLIEITKAKIVDIKEGTK